MIVVLGKPSLAEVKAFVGALRGSTAELVVSSLDTKLNTGPTDTVWLLSYGDEVSGNGADVPKLTCASGAKARVPSGTKNLADLENARALCSAQELGPAVMALGNGAEAELEVPKAVTLNNKRAGSLELTVKPTEGVSSTLKLSNAYSSTKDVTTMVSGSSVDVIVDKKVDPIPASSSANIAGKVEFTVNEFKGSVDVSRTITFDITPTLLPAPAPKPTSGEFPLVPALAGVGGLVIVGGGGFAVSRLRNRRDESPVQPFMPGNRVDPRRETHMSGRLPATANSGPMPVGSSAPGPGRMTGRGFDPGPPPSAPLPPPPAKPAVTSPPRARIDGPAPFDHAALPAETAADDTGVAPAVPGQEPPPDAPEPADQTPDRPTLGIEFGPSPEPASGKPEEVLADSAWRVTVPVLDDQAPADAVRYVAPHAGARHVAPVEAARTRLWSFDHGNMIGVAVYTEKLEGKGEDADPTLLAVQSAIPNASCGAIGVYDGLGGAGAGPAIALAGGQTFNQAAVASRLARQEFQNWVHADDWSDPHPLHDRLADALRDTAALLPYRESAVSSNLSRTLPTTIATLTVEEVEKRSKQYKLQALWAGDSRAYLLTPDEGLQQLTLDHVRHPDVLDQLINDSPMRNVASASQGFHLGWNPLTVTGPFVAICATDGVHGYVMTPGQTEGYILQALNEARSSAEWAKGMARLFLSYTGDDASLALLAVGWTNFAKLRKAFIGRYRDVERDQVAPFKALKDDPDRETYIALRAEAWAGYKPNYSRHMPEPEEAVRR